MIIPEENESQDFVKVDFKTSVKTIHEYSENGYGFRTIRVKSKEPFDKISFEARIRLLKKAADPFGSIDLIEDPAISYSEIQTLLFRIEHDSFLRNTDLTFLPSKYAALFTFDKEKSIFENLQALNQFIFNYVSFMPNMTDVNSTVAELIEKKQGVCQDMVHFFCALARHNGIPTRYVSGFLHQGNGYFGDSQMHAWSEAFIPNAGWIGFDPTNNILANNDHIKVAHGKDYSDCAPLKGVINGPGTNKTQYTVQVESQQQ